MNRSNLNSCCSGFALRRPRVRRRQENHHATRGEARRLNSRGNPDRRHAVHLRPGGRRCGWQDSQRLRSRSQTESRQHWSGSQGGGHGANRCGQRAGVLDGRRDVPADECRVHKLLQGSTAHTDHRGGRQTGRAREYRNHGDSQEVVARMRRLPFELTSAAVASSRPCFASCGSLIATHQRGSTTRSTRT